MRAHKITFAALVVAAGLSLTACQNDDDAAAQTGPSSVATASPSSDGPGSGGSDSASPGRVPAGRTPLPGPGPMSRARPPRAVPTG